ncbi:MAG: virulence RhuM family protein [Buchananella hordeovulneris]|nr:virulence RhuM family protein [Buchananella hordeovulneris]
MSKSVGISRSSGELLVFTSADRADVEVRFDDGTIWATQKTMSELFDVAVATVNHHLKQVYASGELAEDRTIREFLIVRSEGKRVVSRQVKHYNLDAIISVGYRVNSLKATQFRQWATGVLRDFTLRGYVLDRSRIENGEIFGEDYFEKLLEEIREIRLSERRFYQKITDIYATACDYSADAEATRAFFATVQNKLHYAVHGHTAAELIMERADSDLPNMGLTSWRNAPDGKIIRSDVTVGKNYLTKEELDDLGRLVEAYLNLAESRARRKIPTTMMEWIKFLDQVLELDSRELLQAAGRITKKLADKHAVDQFEVFRVRQDEQYVSDFDRFESTAIAAVERSNRHPS